MEKSCQDRVDGVGQAKEGKVELDAERIAFMSEAVRMARESAGNGGGPFGAIIVLKGEIVGRGVNRVTASHDPTAHAEVEAIRDAGRNLKSHSMPGAELYASCEPCPMCLAACYWAGIERVYYSATTGQAAKAGFDDAFIYRELRLESPLRNLQLLPLLPELGEIPFDAWRENPSRREY